MAVSINGSGAITFNDASVQNTAATGFGFKSRIINGAMAVGQRGAVVFTSTNNLYGWVDRWLVSISGTTVSALGYQAAGLTSGSNATSTGYALQIGNLLTTGATTAAVSQRIEAINCNDLSGASVTFTGKVMQGTGVDRTLTISISKATAGVNNWNTQSVIGSTTISVPTGNSTWTPFTYTLALGSADAVNGISVSLAFNNLPAQTNSQIYFADCQLEKGSTATSFDYRPYGTELALCQRYYAIIGCDTQGYSPSGYAVFFSLTTPQPMRTSATVTYSTLATTNFSSISFSQDLASCVRAALGANAGNTSVRWLGNIFLNAEL